MDRRGTQTNGKNATNFIAHTLYVSRIEERTRFADIEDFVDTSIQEDEDYMKKEQRKISHNEQWQHLQLNNKQKHNKK